LSLFFTSACSADNKRPAQPNADAVGATGDKATALRFSRRRHWKWSSAPRYTLLVSKKVPLKDFRARRSKLERHEFAISEGQDAPPSQLIDEVVWHGIMHLPEDVSIRISDHNGTRLRLLHGLWQDWITAIGNPSKPDEIYNCLLARIIRRMQADVA
jgi:hypothetical protein